MPRRRRGVTAIETAIILVAFIIMAASFAFIVLNMGFIVSQKSQSVVFTSMREVSSGIQIVGDVKGYFQLDNDQSNVNLTKIVFYIRLLEGHEPVDASSGKLMVTYTNSRCHSLIYETNGTVTTLITINGDGDPLIEWGEQFKVVIDFTQITDNMVDPPTTSIRDRFTHPYEGFRIDMHPPTPPSSSSSTISWASPNPLSIGFKSRALSGYYGWKD